MWKKHSFYDERKACKKSIKQCHENYEKHLLEFMSHSIRHVGQKPSGDFDWLTLIMPLCTSAQVSFWCSVFRVHVAP